MVTPRVEKKEEEAFLGAVADRPAHTLRVTEQLGGFKVYPGFQVWGNATHSTK